MENTRNMDERGATAVEYCLVIALVAMIIVGALSAFEPKIDSFVSDFNFGGETTCPDGYYYDDAEGGCVLSI